MVVRRQQGSDLEHDLDAQSYRGVNRLIRVFRSSVANLAGLGAATVVAMNQFKSLKEAPQAVWKEAPSWLGGSIVLALLTFLAVVSIWTLVEKKRAQLVTPASAPLRPGYFSLRPREPDENFSRADLAHEKALLWTRGSDAPLLYLTGASGTGKSSIVSAWIIPKLGSENHVVIRLRGYENLVPRITEEILKPGTIWERPVRTGGDLRAQLTRASRSVGPARRIFIFVDQFEEFLALKSPEQQKPFRDFVVSLHAAPIEGLRIVLSFRSEHEGIIDTEGWPQRLLEHNLFEVFPFNEPAAQKFMKESKRTIDPNLLAAVLREGSDIEQGAIGLIRPITLNLCGLVLDRFASGPPRKFRGKIIRSFLRESLSLPETREVAAEIIPHLITKNVTKRTRTIASLAKETGISKEAVRACLYRLGREDRGIVRPLDGAQESWEISHDFLVTLLDGLLATTTVSWWRLYRPWFPWLAALSMGVTAALIPMISRLDPSLMLTKQGWKISEKRGVVIAERKGPIPKESIFYLSRLSNLSLHLQGSDVFQVTDVQDLPDLVQLDLDNTPISSLPDMKRLLRLNEVNLSFTKIVDISRLRDLRELQNLNLSFTHVRDLSPLAGLRHLNTLDLHNDSDLTSVTSLRGLTSLQELNLSATGVTDLTDLGGLSGLKQLDLSGTDVSQKSLAPIHNLTLQTLNLMGTPASQNSASGVCQNFAGTWQTAGDLSPVVIAQKGCFISGTFSNFDGSFKHTFVGNSTPAGAAVIVHRRDPEDCQVEMYGFIGLAGDLLIYQLSGTSGRCNLSPTMAETRIWRRG